MNLVLGVTEDAKTRLALQRACDDLDLRFTFIDPAAFDTGQTLEPAYSLILLDTQSKRDYRELCGQLKAACSSPVVALIANGREKLMIDLRQMGVTDCIVKPLRHQELKARIQAALATGNPDAAQSNLKCGRLEVDLLKRRVYKDGREITVTRTIYRLLVYFLQHKSRVVTHEELLREVWDYDSSADDRNLVETAVRRLRMQIEDDPRNPQCLHTIWGVGYRFEETV